MGSMCVPVCPKNSGYVTVRVEIESYFVRSEYTP